MNVHYLSSHLISSYTSIHFDPGSVVLARAISLFKNPPPSPNLLPLPLPPSSKILIQSSDFDLVGLYIMLLLYLRPHYPHTFYIILFSYLMFIWPSTAAVVLRSRKLYVASVFIHW